MSRRTATVALIALAAVLLIAVGGLFAFDRTHKDLIAQGVTIGGIDVGGLRVEEARTKLNEAYLAPLRQRLTVKAYGHNYHLSARQARLKVNINETVDRALDSSRGGNPFGRAIRDITGGDLDVALAPDVSYSEQAVNRLVSRIAKRVDREPINASVDFGADGVTVRPGKDGLTLRRKRLRDKIAAVLVAPASNHRIRAGVAREHPQLSTKDVAGQYETAMVVDRNSFKLKLYKKLKLVKTYDIAVGAVGLETPAGMYNIQNKAVNPAWNVPNSAWAGELAGTVVPSGDPGNPLKARWMGIFDGAGIHGIDPSEYGTIGHAASHGCVRMRIPDVIELYDRVDVGTPIYIA